MLDKEKVGHRIRQVRTEQQKTLRDVESASGFSSTHISEIERGRTCPTIGALIQIADALEKDPSYFIEERELQEIVVTSPGRRANVDPNFFDIEGTGILLESLTPGILGGRLMIMEMILVRRERPGDSQLGPTSRSSRSKAASRWRSTGRRWPSVSRIVGTRTSMTDSPLGIRAQARRRCSSSSILRRLTSSG